jgi:hypothetical protein
MVELQKLNKEGLLIRENNTSSLIFKQIFKDLKREEVPQINEDNKKETNEKKNWSIGKIAGLIASIGVITTELGNLADAYFLTPQSAFLLSHIGGIYYFGLITQAGNILIGSAALLYIAGIAEKYNIIHINLKRVFNIPFFSLEYVPPDLREKEDKKESKKKFSTREVAAGLVGDSILATTLTFVLNNHPILAGINFQPLILAEIALTVSSACLYLANLLKEKLKEKSSK